jgi:hypothetical protein
MKRLLFSIAAFFLFLATAFAQTNAVVMTYNIRLNVQSDGENWWENRKDKVAALMNYYEADFIGAQEVQYEQLEYLLKTLPHYSSVGVGRDDGKTAGEFSNILYNNKNSSWFCNQLSGFRKHPTKFPWVGMRFATVFALMDCLSISKPKSDCGFLIHILTMWVIQQELNQQN